jgi:hypothetical protein
MRFGVIGLDDTEESCLGGGAGKGAFVVNHLWFIQVLGMNNLNEDERM